MYSLLFGILGFNFGKRDNIYVLKILFISKFVILFVENILLSNYNELFFLEILLFIEFLFKKTNNY